MTVPNLDSASATATACGKEPDILSQLARFFPEATPVRIPIKLSRCISQGNGNGGLSTPENEMVFLQATVIEFGTPCEVFFVVNRHLEVGDRFLIESNDGSIYAEASVVALQYHTEWTAVAARFQKPVPNWIVKS